MKTTIFDAATGKTITRDMTADEEKSFNDCVISANANLKEVEDGIAKKATDQASATKKLKTLGLTDDEITALINN